MKKIFNHYLFPLSFAYSGRVFNHFQIWSNGCTTTFVIMAIVYTIMKSWLNV